MSIYLDASVIVSTLVGQAGSAAADQFMSVNDDTVVVSELAAAEVASAVSRLVRIGALLQSDADLCLADFDAWRGNNASDVDLLPADLRMASVFVRRFDLMLRTPDAIHAAVCRQNNLLLVTFDKRLSAAAADLNIRTLLLGAE